MDNITEAKKKTTQKNMSNITQDMLVGNLLHKVNEPGGLEHFTNTLQDLCAG